jgi:hypothetical protein
MGVVAAFDEGESSDAPPLSRHPGEGRGPGGKVLITETNPALSSFPNWTPAFAGVVILRHALV